LFTWFVAKRLFAEGGSSGRASRLATGIATTGVAIGLAVMLVSVAIVLGFQKEVQDKVLGFGAHIKVLNYKSIGGQEFSPIVIDDSQYLLADEFFDRAKENGYQKFTDIALNFRNLIHNINNMGEDDKIVYFLHHSEDDGAGREKVKTIGKMLDEKLTVEGCFDVVIYCRDQRFYTQGDGISSAKTPEGMFDSVEIPNDLKAVDVAIREYYGMEGGA